MKNFALSIVFALTFFGLFALAALPSEAEKSEYRTERNLTEEFWGRVWIDEPYDKNQFYRKLMGLSRQTLPEAIEVITNSGGSYEQAEAVIECQLETIFKKSDPDLIEDIFKKIPEVSKLITSSGIENFLSKHCSS